MKDLPLTLTNRALLPARLCVITRRDGTIYRIAEAQGSITVSAVVYSPIPGLEISAIKHTVNGEMPSMQIDLAHSDGGTFDTAEIDQGWFDGASVQVYIVDRATLATRGLLFTGTIEPVVYDIQGKASFDIRGHAARSTGSFIQRHQAMCRVDLYSPLCGVDATAYDQVGTVGTIIDQFNFTVPDLVSPPVDGYFNLGVAVMASGLAFEVGAWDQSEEKITTFLPVCLLITASEGITLYPGCDWTLGAGGCAKFSNQLNHQAEPHFLGAAAASAQQ